MFRKIHRSKDTVTILSLYQSPANRGRFTDIVPRRVGTRHRYRPRKTRCIRSLSISRSRWEPMVWEGDTGGQERRCSTSSQPHRMGPAPDRNSSCTRCVPSDFSCRRAACRRTNGCKASRSSRNPERSLRTPVFPPVHSPNCQVQPFGKQMGANVEGCSTSSRGVSPLPRHFQFSAGSPARLSRCA